MDLNLRDYYRFYRQLPLGQDQVQYRFKDQIEVFGDRFRRIFYDAQVTQDPDNLIQDITEEFSEFEIRWKVGRTDSPDIDWGSRLEGQGFEAATSEMAMIFDLEQGDLSHLADRLSDEIVITQVTSRELNCEAFTKLHQREKPDRTPEVHRAGLENYLSLEERGLRYLHLVAISGDLWVGHGVLSYVDEGDVAFLAGALTDKDFRKRGIYSAMVAGRAAHARSLGKRYLVINAIANTSAPILEKIGFDTIAEQKIFRLKKP